MVWNGKTASTVVFCTCFLQNQGTSPRGEAQIANWEFRTPLPVYPRHVIGDVRDPPPARVRGHSLYDWSFHYMLYSCVHIYIFTSPRSRRAICADKQATLERRSTKVETQPGPCCATPCCRCHGCIRLAFAHYTVSHLHLASASSAAQRLQTYSDLPMFERATVMSSSPPLAVHPVLLLYLWPSSFPSSPPSICE